MTQTRRGFLSAAGATALASVAVPSGSHALAETQPTLANVRDAFEFTEARVPMNAANLCPSPRSVADAVSNYTRLIDIDPSFQNRARFNELLEASRAAVAKPLGVTPDEIALVRNTSEANNIINSGLDLEAGDEVVVWDQNHPTNNVAWDVRAARYNLVVKRVSLPRSPTGSVELIEPFARAISPRTRVLTVTHISNVSGLKVPLDTLGELCRQHDIHFHVDGAQTWGAVDVNLKEIGCDSFSGSAHKWFLGPKEVGLLYVRESVIERIWPSTVAPGWGDDASTDLVGARKFESLGQRDDAALTAVATAAALHEALGPAEVEAHMVALSQRLKEGLVDAGAQLVTPMDPAFSGGVCIAEVDPAKRGKLYDRLYREHGIIGAPTGGLRLCPHLYNTTDHVDRAIAGVTALQSLLT